jgi:hypothetical protein
MTGQGEERGGKERKTERERERRNQSNTLATLAGWRPFVWRLSEQNGNGGKERHLRNC